uniref:Uncharacterized protein n=1 Tax=Anguilla anguilla TaxID=7936 RepID=A0A0E9W855_ANGAN
MNPRGSNSQLLNTPEKRTCWKVCISETWRPSSKSKIKMVE